MARVKTISYGRTFNNGNYDSSRIDVVVELEKGEDPEEAFETLKELVDEFREQETNED